VAYWQGTSHANDASTLPARMSTTIGRSMATGQVSVTLSGVAGAKAQQRPVLTVAGQCWAAPALVPSV